MNLADLGRRAVACKHWRWMPGMLLLWKLNERGSTYRGRVCHLGGSDSGTGKDVYCEGRGDRFDGVLEVPKCIPDLSDPATLGCLLHLVRQAWGDPDLYADRVSRAHDKLPDVWQVYVFHESGVKDVLSGRSEIEALVAALEAAP